MKNDLSIVMYHYVRDIEKSNFSKLKALDIKHFCNQIDFLCKNYNVISGNELISYILREEKNLPPKACLLTFDDGYKDHIDYVLPELSKRKLKGCFFPVTSTIEKFNLLDVNAIQLILASVDDINKLLLDLKKEFLSKNLSIDLFNKLWEQNAKNGRYDNKKIIFIKKTLQYSLPFKIRKKIIKALFKKYIKIPSKNIAEEIYMSKKDLECLFDSGMTIGNHTHNHEWLAHLNVNEQRKEILQSLNFIKQINKSEKDWIMCYPFGSYNANTLDILSKYNCIAALTTKTGRAFLNNKKNFFELNRFDTNDFK
jgi:peptidoglycan/xylan/chitin deacetylase (PgdA/CDA1 family)